MPRGPAGLKYGELTRILEIDTVQFFELRGLAFAGFKEPEQDIEGLEPDDVRLGIQPTIRIRPDGLDVRLRLRAKTVDGSVVADAAIFYSVDEGASLPHVSDALARRFADQVASPDLLPYIRQAIDELSARLLPQRIIMPPVPGGTVDYRQVDILRETE